MKLTDKITYHLVNQFQATGYDIVLPNFFVGRYEMDVFRRLKSGYINEYEVKISRSDFFNDFKKSHHEHIGEYPYKKIKINKHSQLKNGFGIPNKFWFVVPEGLIDVGEIPKHTGLIYFIERYETFKIIKTAPFLHRNKKEDKEYLENLLVSLSHREMSFRFKADRLRIQYKKQKERPVRQDSALPS